ncbi:MAG: hypothetical protein UR18_C0006G0023 [Candidatus Nomurabacteria bacterium GW2011_GWE2_31_40]|nr:MAG: hypothetical protein UR18_C0006G0023 [Candidatus Nomurabacteria bacterium GW2011_GWE2_31_40]OGV06201.1 MAG: hypothetical protein A2299_12245 [Stygiobacter sp. RIFOXYB2_FULL_37_11]OGV15951.1 MAG: hypothetical protein A2440_03175 [Stygiobacter sp. RIFOXYC2_FULL_38_25]OGV27895.1 MAG: hypothetical protein A2499_17280 [Stygiobacter sp. RIFOXYC12_FULL_38_8]OGV80428.1 MAG: hypothetical protein A2X65_04335 [Stygiobacter sp. GWF2_38_21]
MEPVLNKIQDAVTDRIIMQRVAGQGIFIIRQRTKKGQYLEGSSPGSENYSTNPFAMPVGAVNKMTGNKINSLAKSDPDKFHLFRSKKTNSLWVLVTEGYKRIRQLAGKNSDVVTMSWSGKVMRNLAAVSVEPREAKLGFEDERAKQISIWQNIMGAGKSKKKKIYMGFSKKEIEELSLLASKEMAANIIRKLQ